MVFLDLNQLSSVASFTESAGEDHPLYQPRFLGRGGVGQLSEAILGWWKAMCSYPVIPPPARVALHLGDHQGAAFPTDFHHIREQEQRLGFLCVERVSEPVLEPVHHARSPCKICSLYICMKSMKQSGEGHLSAEQVLCLAGLSLSVQIGFYAGAVNCPLLPRSESCRHEGRHFFFYHQRLRCLNH